MYMLKLDYRIINTMFTSNSHRFQVRDYVSKYFFKIYPLI